MKISLIEWKISSNELMNEFYIRTSQVFTTPSTPASSFFNNRSHFPQLDVTLNLCCHRPLPHFSVGVLIVGVLIVGVLTVGASTVGVLTVGASTVGVLSVEAMLLSPVQVPNMLL